MDGGYYLLGLQQSQPMLFEGFQWGVDTVLANTLDRADKLMLGLQELRLLNDVDQWSDVLEIAPQVPQLRRLLRDKL